MNKTHILKCIFLFLIGCCACNSLTKSSSVVILPLDSVVAIIADCYFLEGEIYVKQWNYNVKDHTLVKYNSFFEKRGLTKELFAKNVEYYITNEKYSELFMNKLDEVVEQRVAALKDTLDLEPQ